jgi:long-chain fatty acid transport protein
MSKTGGYLHASFQCAVAVAALVLTAGTALAGGFAVREQSTSSQGASFAGSAAGYDLSSMFWNPAAVGMAGYGFTTESHFALIIPDASVSVSSPVTPFADSTDIGHLAVVPASYGAYRISKDLVVGLSINSPFGLATKPENTHWAGSFLGTTSRMFTVNIAPTLSYQVAPGLYLGAGVQFEYMSLLFRFRTPTGLTTTGIATADVDDNLGVGFTAGVLWQPTSGTSVGLGFRSSVEHNLRGDLDTPTPLGSLPIGANFDTPEIVTLSIRQAIAPNWRVLGTIEWTNWSRFDSIPIDGTKGLPGFPPGGLSLDGDWHDSWLYSVGLEYDVSQKLTVRSGVAFERSPIQNPEERLIQVPDSDRWWASAGFTYRLSEKTAIDVAYTHIFFDDAPFARQSLLGGQVITGEADQSADIISGSLKMRW